MKINNRFFYILLSAFFGFWGGFVAIFFLGKVASFFDTPSKLLFLQNSQSKEQVINPFTQDLNIIKVVKESQDAVVSIVATKEVSVFDATGPDLDGFLDQPFERDQTVTQEVAGGTGFIIDSGGLILTNRHVVTDPNVTYTVILNDGSQYLAQVIDRDFLNDIAFVKIDGKNLPILELGDSSQIQIGQTVLAIGNVLSEYSNTVTKGIISGIDRRVFASSGLSEVSVIDSAIQTDAAINPGNSGGPLLNLSGQVIGINTAVDLNGSRVGFAIPINEASRLIDGVKEFGRIIRPFLGVRYVLVNDRIFQRENLPIDYGALVLSSDQNNSAIIPQSPADKIGLQPRDIIYQVNDQKITLDDGLAQVLSNYVPGDFVILKVKRGQDDLELKVQLADRDDFIK